MGLFDQFPYTNFHELNLDWILQALKELEHTIEQFVAINALKYADPIQWNITSQYEKNTIVIDPQSGTAYISVQPVPSGVALTNEDYWTVVFDLGQFVVRASKNFANTYEAETTLTATVSTAAGGWIIWGDTLYKALVNITAGDSYVVGGNIAHFTMEDIIGHLEDLTTTDKSNLVAAINDVVTNLAGEATARENADTQLQTNINNEAQARENADTQLQTNINNEAQARENADTQLQTNINNEAQARENADSLLQTNINNETQARTDADSALRTYIDEQLSTIDSIGGFAEQYSGKSILIIGDSLSYDTGNSWTTKFKAMAENLGCTVNNISQSGADTVAALTALNSVTDSYDIAILWIGINDIGLHRPIGYVTTNDTFMYNYAAIINKLRTINDSMRIFAFSISHYNDNEYNSLYSPILYSAAIRGVCTPRGIAFKDISGMQNASLLNHTSQYTDGVHFLPEYSQNALYYTIINKMLNANSDAYDYSISVNSYCLVPATGATASDVSGLYSTNGSFKLQALIQTAASINAGDPIATLQDPFKPIIRTRVILITGTSTAISGYIDTSGIITAGVALPAGFYTIIADVTPASAGLAAFLA